MTEFTNFRMFPWANTRVSGFVNNSVIRVAIWANVGRHRLFPGKRKRILKLFRSLARALATDRLYLNNHVGIEDRLDGDFWFIGLNWFWFWFANGFLRHFHLNHQARTKCKGADIGDKARADIGRINKRRSLAIDGQGCVNKGMNEGIANLNFSGQRNNRTAAARNVTRFDNTLWWAKIRVRGITKMDFPAKEAARRRKWLAVDLDLFNRIVMSGWNHFTFVRRMFNSQDSNMKNSVLRNNKIIDIDNRRRNMVRNTSLNRNISCLNSNKNFLASNSVSASRIFTFLIGSHIGNSHYFADFSIASGWLPLAAASKGRNVSDNGTNLRQFASKFTDSGAKNKKFRRANFTNRSIPFAISKAARDVGRTTSWNFARKGLDSFANDFRHATFFGPRAIARWRYASIVFFRIGNSTSNSVFGFWWFSQRNLLWTMSTNDAIARLRSNSRIKSLCFLIVKFSLLAGGHTGFIKSSDCRDLV